MNLDVLVTLIGVVHDRVAGWCVKTRIGRRLSPTLPIVLLYLWPITLPVLGARWLVGRRRRRLDWPRARLVPRRCAK